MNPKTTISITEARKRIFDLADEVQRPGNHYTFTENGKPKVVFMSVDEFESWKETLEVSRIFPDLDKDIKATDRAVKSGAYKKWPTLANIMSDYGFAVADKSKKKYEVGSKVRKQSKKRS